LLLFYLYEDTGNLGESKRSGKWVKGETISPEVGNQGNAKEARLPKAKIGTILALRRAKPMEARP
jgi:hypothetical protein